MAFDGIVTSACAKELSEEILLGRIDKIYQPEPDELMLHIYTKTGVKRLFATVESGSASVRLVDKNSINPPVPLKFCMLLRKQLSGARISCVEQKDSERILEISMETMNELGFTVSKKLIFEIMGKHSNIVLVNLENNKIIDSIKHVSIDVNRARQILPGKEYVYPPAQDKIPFKEASEADWNGDIETWKGLLSKIGGISPASARELFSSENRYEKIQEIQESISSNTFSSVVYLDDTGMPVEYSVFPLTEYEKTCEALSFSSLSDALEYYYEHKGSSSRAKQRAHDLIHAVNMRLDKLYLKKQRLNEDLLAAENAEDLRLYGELLTANMHLLKSGMNSVSVTNYYNGEQVEIPLDPRLSPNRNAQQYFKRYGKSKTAVKEKQVQIEENQVHIDYLESILTYLQNTNEVQDIDDLRGELEESGYIRARKQNKRGPKKKYKPAPLEFFTATGTRMLIGRNNKENDELTLRMASRTDYWFHTKDIPGSHLILFTQGKTPSEEDIFEAAAAAAYYSKGRTGENIPVDYVQVRYVKKPSGAKPGMVIFTDNRTVYVNPKEPTRTQIPEEPQE